MADIAVGTTLYMVMDNGNPRLCISTIKRIGDAYCTMETPFGHRQRISIFAAKKHAQSAKEAWTHHAGSCRYSAERREAEAKQLRESAAYADACIAELG